MGFVHDAQKEFAEANITFSLIIGKPLPDPDELGIGYAAYLNGLGEAVGELRRYVLDSLRRDELARSEEVLSIMDDIYNTLITMDFPDAITHGLRRTTDSVRGILERTRGDLTIVLRQKSLEEKLDRFTDYS
jgi:translin